MRQLILIALLASGLYVSLTLHGTTTPPPPRDPPNGEFPWQL